MDKAQNNALKKERQRESTLLLSRGRPSGVGPSVRLRQRHRLDSLEGGRKESHRQFSPSVSVSARASLRLSVRASFGLAHGKGACGMPQGRRSRSVGRLTLAGSRRLLPPSVAGQVVGSGEPRRLGPPKDNRRTHACERFPATRGDGYWR